MDFYRSCLATKPEHRGTAAELCAHAYLSPANCASKDQLASLINNNRK